MSQRHQQRTAGVPLTRRERPLRVGDVDTEPGDLTVIDAAQRIYALHNEDPGDKGGYLLYDPFVPRRIGGRRKSKYPRVGYVAIAAGHEIKRDSAVFEQIVTQVQKARVERSDPGSGRIHV